MQWVLRRRENAANRSGRDGQRVGLRPIAYDGVAMAGPRVRDIRLPRIVGWTIAAGLAEQQLDLEEVVSKAGHARGVRQDRCRGEHDESQRHDQRHCPAEPGQAQCR